MFGDQITVFPKQIKIDDYSEYQEGNVISILESSNLLLGSGARASNAAVVLSKALHYSIEEGAFPLKGKTVLDLGCGVGLVGVYLACLGFQVILSDVPSMKDLVQRNIGLNKSLFKGSADFAITNWKKQGCIGKCQQMNENNSSNSTTNSTECLYHLIGKIDLTIVCEGGGINELNQHLKWIGRQGMILCFMERQGENEDFLRSRLVQEILIERQLNYQKLSQYHPDYYDERVSIYHIWK